MKNGMNPLQVSVVSLDDGQLMGLINRAGSKPKSISASHS